MYKNNDKINELSNHFFLNFVPILGWFPGGRDTPNRVKRMGCIAKSWKSHDIILEVEKVVSRSDFKGILSPSWGPKWSQKLNKMMLKK
jgi:hypothetical protein